MRVLVESVPHWKLAYFLLEGCFMYVCAYVSVIRILYAYLSGEIVPIGVHVSVWVRLFCATKSRWTYLCMSVCICGQRKVSR